MASNYILSMLDGESKRLSMREQDFGESRQNELKRLNAHCQNMENDRQERTRRFEKEEANVYERNLFEKANARRAADLQEEKRELSRIKYDCYERERDEDRRGDRKNQLYDTLISRESLEGHRSRVYAIEDSARKSEFYDVEMYQKRSVSANKELLAARTNAICAIGDKWIDVNNSRADAYDKGRLAWDSVGRASNKIRGSGNMNYLRY